MCVCDIYAYMHACIMVSVHAYMHRRWFRRWFNTLYKWYNVTTNTILHAHTGICILLDPRSYFSDVRMNSIHTYTHTSQVDRRGM